MILWTYGCRHCIGFSFLGRNRIACGDGGSRWALAFLMARALRELGAPGRRSKYWVWRTPVGWNVLGWRRGVVLGFLLGFRLLSSSRRSCSNFVEAAIGEMLAMLLSEALWKIAIVCQMNLHFVYSGSIYCEMSLGSPIRVQNGQLTFDPESSCQSCWGIGILPVGHFPSHQVQLQNLSNHLDP